MIIKNDLLSLVENAIDGELEPIDKKTTISKIIRVLMNDEVFASQVKSVLIGFKKNRYQVTPQQESILKTIPKKIENIEKVITKLTKYANNPKNKKMKNYSEELVKLNDAYLAKQEGENVLNSTIQEIEDIISSNEELNRQYLEQLLMIIQHSSERILSKHGNIQPEHKKELEFLVNQDEQSVLSDYLDNAQYQYDESKDRFSKIEKNKNYRNMVEQLYYNLPIYSLNDDFFHVLSKNPLNIGKETPKDGNTLEYKLNNVKNEEQFIELLPELEDYLNNAKLPSEKENKIRDIMGSPFISRKGSPNSAIKIKRLMKTKLNETFDNYYDYMIQESSKFDEDDLKLDIMEVCAILEKKCTGPTKKASSDRKGKKWTKCARQPDGSYKRIHWGQEGVRVTGKSGNTKRKKQFRARHKCSDAKPGSPQKAACDDW